MTDETDRQSEDRRDASGHETAGLHSAIPQLRTGARLDARNSFVTKVLLREMIAASPWDRDGRKILRVDFGGATFSEDAWQFLTEDRYSADPWLVIEGNDTFSGAIFPGDALFIGAVFRPEPTSVGTTHALARLFYDARFKREAVFRDAVFQGGAPSFNLARFKGIANFNDARFFAEIRPIGRNVENPRGNSVLGDAWFHSARFGRGLSVGGIAELATLRLSGARFLGGWAGLSAPQALDLTFAHFADGVGLSLDEGDHDRLALDNAVFQSDRTITITKTKKVTLTHTQFTAPIHLTVKDARVDATGAVFRSGGVLQMDNCEVSDLRW